MHSLRTTGRLTVDCVQAAEDARTRKRSDVIVAAAVALAAVVSVESPFIHVDSIQASLRFHIYRHTLLCSFHSRERRGATSCCQAAAETAR